MKIILFNFADFISGPSLNEALGPRYLKSYFEKYSSLNGAIKIDIANSDILNKIVKERPEVIGISVATEFYPEAIKFTESIKKMLPDIRIVIGGYHVTNMPHTFNRKFNFGVIGEGEETFLELTEGIYYKKSEEDLMKIKGLIFFDRSGNLVKTQERSLIDNPDDIPFPYRQKEKGKIFAHIITSRGCPFACAFCASSAFWKKTIRYHSPDYVFAEMRDLIENHGIRHITIWDDLFIGDKNRLIKISRLIKEQRGLFRNVTFGVSARANLIARDTQLLDIFKQINVIRVSIGFESGSDRMLKMLKGESASLENNRKALELLKRYRFFINGGFIIGSPGEQIEDIEETYKFIINSKIDGGYAGLAIPYPNTEFWNYAQRKELVNDNMDFGKLKLTTNFKSLRNKDFILLSEGLNRRAFVDYGIKIQEYFARRSLKMYFDSRILNPRILLLFSRNPFNFFSFLLEAFSNFVKNTLCLSRQSS